MILTVTQLFQKVTIEVNGGHVKVLEPHCKFRRIIIVNTIMLAWLSMYCNLTQ